MPAGALPRVPLKSAALRQDDTEVVITNRQAGEPAG